MEKKMAVLDYTKRLTDAMGSLCTDCNGIGYCKTDCLQHQMYEKLKAYEDLGFTPTEIALMAKFYKEHTSVEFIKSEMNIVAKLVEWSKWKELENQGRLFIIDEL